MSQENASRTDAVKALVSFEEAKTSMKTLLRQMQTTSPDSYEQQSLVQNLALSVVRYRNTIDFILTRSFSKNKFQELDPKSRNILRLALYDSKWLKTDFSDILTIFPEIASEYLKEFRTAVNFNLEAAIRKLPETNRLSLEYSHPTFLVKTLLENLDLDDAIQLMKASNQGRTYYIRPNQLHDDYESALDSLEHVTLKSDPNIPEVSQVLHGIDAVVTSKEFRTGQVLIQDKASILTVKALDPKPGEKIWDACAAPGMKTQLIAEKLKGRGELIATDIYEERVKVASELSQHLLATQIEWLQADATKPVVADADKILIDAPCTSTGVLQTYPSFKWRLNKETLFALMTVQNKILDAILTTYAERPGTEIVYSTCSILPHEGESQIESAIKRHNVDLLKPLDYGSPGYSKFDCSDKVTRLFPHKHYTSGFFIARLRIMH